LPHFLVMFVPAGLAFTQIDRDNRSQSPQVTESSSVTSFPVQVPVDTLTGALAKTSYQVSCEDLLDFATDKSFGRSTRRPSIDIDSDEIRVMQKVLANEVCE
jgi:hypothetical protein